MENFEDEKRKEKRVEFGAQVLLKSDSAEILANTTAEDISLTGILIKTDKKIDVGKPCDLEVILKGRTSRLSLFIKGTVVRQTDNGLGIVFDGLEVDSFFHLNNFLNHSVLDPKTITKQIFPLD